MNDYLPEPLEPVVAFIQRTNSLGLFKWHEVVLHDGDRWRSFQGSKTFEDGEIVIQWVYTKDIFYKVTIRPELL